jgi:hypothetical protein
MTGKRDEAAGTFYGIIRGLKDPQMWANKWLSQSMHILNTSAKSGAWVEDGAVEDIRELETNYARPGAMLKVTPGALSQGRIKDRDAPAMPAGFHQLLQFAIMSIPDVSGISREALGLADREQAGILEAQRKQSSQAVMAPLFDALRLYYKRDGKQMLRLVAQYIPPTKQMRILTGEQQDPQVVSTAMLPDVREYDLIVDEAPTSPNQKAEMWQFIGPALPTLIGKVPMSVVVEMLRFSPLPESGIARLEGLAQQFEQQQAQQPNPEAEKANADMAMQQQKLAFEQQKHQQEMAFKAAEFEFEQRKAEQEFALEQQKAEFEAQMQARDAQLKLAEADHQARIREADSARENDRAMREIERQSEMRSFERGEIAEIVKPFLEEMAGPFTEATQGMVQSQAQMRDLFASMHDAMMSPAEIVRGSDGRLAGVRRVRQSVQ